MRNECPDRRELRLGGSFLLANLLFLLVHFFNDGSWILFSLVVLHQLEEAALQRYTLSCVVFV